MLFLVPLAVFIVCTVLMFLWVGWKTALSFVGLWVLGFFVCGFFGVSGYIFISYQALLAAVMFAWLKLHLS